VISNRNIGKSSYEIWLTTDAGHRIAQLTTFISAKFSRSVNRIAAFNMLVPQSFNIDLVQPDRMIQVWRQPAGGRLGLWRAYFLRRWRFFSRNSDIFIELGGPDTNDLLRRRIVAAFSGSSQAAKTDFADDMMKEVVREAVADGVAPTPDAGTRVWNNLSIAADLGAGPTITKSFPFDKLLTSSGQGVLDVLSRASKEAGTPVWFDIVPDTISGSGITFRFETYTGQPGQDVSDRVVFDEARGNMRDAELEYDYTDEVNYIYAAGQGVEDERQIEQVYDDDRYNQSIWGRIEGEADSRNESGNGVRESGRDALNEGRPKIRFSAVPTDTTGTRFGIHWNVGDKVQARYLNRQFYSIISAVSISLNNNGEEQVDARLDFESTI